MVLTIEVINSLAATKEVEVPVKTELIFAEVSVRANPPAKLSEITSWVLKESS